MNLSAALTTKRRMAIELFSGLRTKAVRGTLAQRLFGRSNALSAFSEVLPCLSPDRRYAGVQNIRLDQITGSVGRAADFDQDFRPLKTHLRERWVSNYLYMEGGSLEAILVYQVGDTYYVEDGHHRVSVARATGRIYIEAEVWEYHLAPAISPAQVPAEAPSRVAAECWYMAPACSCTVAGQKA